MLRGVDELAEGDVHVGAGGALRVGGRRSRTGDVNAAAPGSELSRTRAVRDAQLLWIPSAGLESLARVSPRAFVALAWRMGARARGRRSRGVGGGGGGGGFSRGDSGGSPRGGLGDVIGDTGSLFSAGGISGAYSADHHPGKASHAHPNAAEDIRRGQYNSRGRSQGALDETPFAPRTVAVVPVSEGAALALDEFVAATHRALSRTCAATNSSSANAAPSDTGTTATVLGANGVSSRAPWERPRELYCPRRMSSAAFGCAWDALPCLLYTSPSPRDS